MSLLGAMGNFFIRQVGLARFACSLFPLTQRDFHYLVFRGRCGKKKYLDGKEKTPEKSQGLDCKSFGGNKTRRNMGEFKLEHRT